MVADVLPEISGEQENGLPHGLFITVYYAPLLGHLTALEDLT